ncbi:MAG: prolipoprotein diacylglyceryl transferase [Anaerolineales bacterium]|nr:prolipoprotein diacylglyceryl transferase [Anaerolineales bacterium]
MFPTLTLGPISLQLPGLIAIFGLWLGLTMAERHSTRFGVKADVLYNLVFTMLIAGVIGARLSYVVRYPSAFTSNLLGIFTLNPSLLDPFGGIAAAGIAGLVYGQRKSMPLWPTLDALTPLLAVLLVALPVADLSSGAAFGAPTDLPWGIELWGTTRHPTQIYQALIANFILWLLLVKPRRRKLAPGMLFLQFVTLSAGARLFVEAFRGDSVVLFGGICSAQVAAWIVLALGLFGLYKRLFPSEATPTVEIAGE